jgi:hypothetical protein
MKQAVEDGVDETHEGYAIEKDMQRMWSRLESTEKIAASAFAAAVSDASMSTADDRLGDLRGKISCNHAEKCSARMCDLELGFECGGALPHPPDACEECPVHPEARCEPIIPEEE